MNKNIKNIVSIGILLSIMSGNIVPVLAADTIENSESINTQILNNESYLIINGQSINNRTILTLDQVINAAIDNSEKLKLKSQEISMYRKKEELQDKTNDFYESFGEEVYDFPYDKLELLEKQANQSKSFLQDQMANDITNKYNEIIIKQIDINKSKINLEIKNKDLQTMKTKVEIGMGTSNQLSDKQIEINSLQNDITAKENSLKNSMDYLGVLTNLNLSNYTLDQSIKYDVFKIDGLSDDYIDNKIETYLKYNQKLISLTKDYLDELKDDGVKDIIGENVPSIPNKTSYMQTNAETGTSEFNTCAYALALINYEQNALKYYIALTTYGSYLDGKYGVDEAQVKLDDSKKSLKNGLKECYSTLLALENKINDLNDTIKLTNTKLKYAETQVDIGMMTENNYKALVLKSEDLDTSLRSLINTYNNLKTTIQEPWILSVN